MNIFLALVTLYALFADDIRQVAFPMSSDLTFSIIDLVCIGIFIAEVVVLSIFKVKLKIIQ
jgi:hypothetical protein